MESKGRGAELKPQNGEENDKVANLSYLSFTIYI